MLAKVIMLKKSWKTVASAANYVVDDLKKTPGQINQAKQAEPGLYAPEDGANYLMRDGVLEAASFNMEGLNPTDPDDRRQIIKWMDSTARAWAARSRALSKTNPFYHVVLSWKAAVPMTRITPEGTAMRGTQVARPDDMRVDACCKWPARADTSGSTRNRFSKNACTRACTSVLGTNDLLNRQTSRQEPARAQLAWSSLDTFERIAKKLRQSWHYFKMIKICR